MWSLNFIDNVICAFDDLLVVYVHPELIHHIGSIRPYLVGTSKALPSEPLTKEARNAVATLLSSTELVSFSLGIGLWLSLSARKLQSPVDNEIHCAKVVHSATTGAIICEESEITFVMYCMAKEFLDSVQCHSTRTTSIMNFFRYCLQVESKSQKPTWELQRYTKLRFQRIGHDEALLREFPALVGTWLFLYDINLFFKSVPREEADLLDLDFQRTFENFEKIFLALAKMTHMRLQQAKEAEEWVTKLCVLHSKSSSANQHLLMLVPGSVAHSMFLYSLADLQNSLDQMVNGMKSGLKQSMYSIV